MPEGGVDGGGGAAVDDAEADGGIGIEESRGEEAVAAAVVDDGEFACGAWSVLRLDAFAEDPGVAGFDRAFPGGGQADFETGSGHGLVFELERGFR